ncbi:MAG: hypothetical protein JWO51_855 [Rhodospirillales bacterium]|nr:hypothetical protein [Rhodospirillales bacterium]
MISPGLKSLARLPLDVYRIGRFDLPSPMRRDIARTLIRLELSPHLPNPVPMMGYNVSYFQAHRLEYLFREIYVGLSYLFHTDNSSPVIFDCGSNIGMSVLFFKTLYPQARIWAFEPDPATFEVLTSNVAQNALQDVTLCHCALGDSDGLADFFTDQDDAGSLLMSVKQERMDGERISVPSHRLSTFITEDVDLLKIDVEGAEETVLPELAESGKLSLVKQIHLEYHHHIMPNEDRLSSMLQLLESNGFGYQLVTRSNDWPSPRIFQDVSIYCYRKA